MRSHLILGIDHIIWVLNATSIQNYQALFSFSAKLPCRTTKNNEECRFPFEYRGKTYNKCTYDYSEGEPWCQTSTSYGICNQTHLQDGICEHDHYSGKY